MTTPTDGTAGENAPGRRDWFAPPPNQPAEIPDQPSDITYSGPRPQPPAIPIPGTLRPPQDVRVWPPEPEEAEPEGEDRSTQPFPALRGTPLAAAPQQSGSPYRPPSPAPPALASPANTAEAPARSPRRTALLGAGAALSVVLAVGLPGWFGYNIYRYMQPSDQVQIVQPGQAGAWKHVSWQATLEKIPDPDGKPDTSDRQWLKVVVTRTALDGEGAIRHAAPEVRLTDRAGRLWLTVEHHNETPPDTLDNKIGTPYRIELHGVVPPSVADQVEVLLRPSTYRSVPDQSVEDMKEATEIEEKADHVLRFRR